MSHRLPKRPGPYILALLVIILAVLVAWMYKALDSIEPRTRKLPSVMPRPTSPAGEPPQGVPPSATTGIDPANLERAMQLNSDSITPQEDLDIIEEFIDLYRKAYGDNPVGLNADITASLTGKADPNQTGGLFPAASPAIRGGQLMDRWGSPFWFHPVSGAKMEIRSAGPDRQLFTDDDVIKNDSGVTGGAEVPQ